VPEFYIGEGMNEINRFAIFGDPVKFKELLSVGYVDIYGSPATADLETRR
jgi:hypothetical protein